MAALPDLITVAQYRQLPDDGKHLYELHHGEIVEVNRPKPGHWMLHRHVDRLLQPKLAGFGEVAVEFPFRAVAEFDLRAADVAVLSHARWKAIDPEVDVFGSPELVIEVISPSNTRGEIREMAALCLNHGAIEFWILDRKRKSATVIRKDGTTTVYGRADRIPLTAFGSDSLAVSAIFE